MQCFFVIFVCKVKCGENRKKEKLAEGVGVAKSGKAATGKAVEIDGKIGK